MKYDIQVWYTVNDEQKTYAFLKTVSTTKLNQIIKWQKEHKTYNITIYAL